VGVGCRFHVLRYQTHFRRYQGHRVPFSCFALPGTFSAVRRASSPDFMFCAPSLVFAGTEGVGSRFHVLRSRTPFRRYPWASGTVFIFCAPVLIFGGNEGVGSRFHVLRAQTPFSAVPRESGPIFLFCAPGLVFDDIQGDAGIVYMFCAPGLIFGGTKGVGSHFHVLRSRTHFLRYRRRRVPFSCFVLPNSFSAVPRASGPVFMFCGP
jgi:hypothetical protein